MVERNTNNFFKNWAHFAKYKFRMKSPFHGNRKRKESNCCGAACYNRLCRGGTL